MVPYFIAAPLVASVLAVTVISLCASRKKSAAAPNAGQASLPSQAIVNAPPQRLDITPRHVASTDVNVTIRDEAAFTDESKSAQDGPIAVPSSLPTSTGAVLLAPVLPSVPASAGMGVGAGQGQAPEPAARVDLEEDASRDAMKSHSRQLPGVSGGVNVTFREHFADSAAWDAYTDHVQRIPLPPPRTAATGVLVSAWQAACIGDAKPDGVLGTAPMTPDEALARLAGKPSTSSSTSSPAQSSNSQHQQRRMEEKELPASRRNIPGALTTSADGKGRSLGGLVGRGAVGALGPTPSSKKASPVLGCVDERMADGIAASTRPAEKAQEPSMTGMVVPNTATQGSTARTSISPPTYLPSNGTGQVVAALGPDVPLDINVEQLDLGDEIGRGGFGRVYAGTYQGTPVAVKMLLGGGNGPSELTALELEVSILSRANHPNVMKIYGGNLSPPQPFIVAELLMCSLHDYIYHPQADSRVVQVVRLAQGIAGALAYLHPAVLHRDLKPGNVLLSAEGTPKVADFGLARWKLKTLLSTQTLEAGSVPYLAPECFDPDNWHLTDRVDIYSLAIMMSEMLMRRPPWHGMSSMQVAWEVHVKGNRPALPLPGPQYPAALLQLIGSCWAQDPKLRPSAADVYRTLSEILEELL